jgi:hypothetical protein
MEALNIALRYFHLTFAFTRFSVRQSGDDTHILIDDSALPKQLRAFVAETA